MSGIVTLITDFGAGSPYVAQMKGVLLGANSGLQLVDVSHGVPPQGVREGALLLRSTGFAFPQGTVHLVVVDPGVGTSRRGLAIACGGMFFVGPDNGVLGGILDRPDAAVVSLDNPSFFRTPVSPTFHGRDIFAPVAAELAFGVSLEQVGTPCESTQPGVLPAFESKSGRLLGEVLGADAFGNLTTNLPGRRVSQVNPLVLRGQELPWVTTYGEAPAQRVVALVGSDGYVEVAVRNDSALNNLGATVVGEPVSALSKE